MNNNYKSYSDKEIPTPYNFVPLSEKVVFPDWSDKVSHDVPFSDGISGELEIEVENTTPIYIRNGGNWTDADKKNNDSKYNDFFQTKEGQTYIPGTSLKGAIRNVLEIASFGKMKAVDNRRYSVRDLDLDAYTNKFTTDIKAAPLTKAGFIKKKGDDWFLIPCDYARIEQCKLAQEIGTSKLSTLEKYKFWKNELNNSLDASFSISKPGPDVFKKQCGSLKRAEINEGNINGKLVFTGQIAHRQKRGEGEHGRGKKHLEFVFFDKGNKELKISTEMKNDFILNHSETRNKDKHLGSLKPNEEWGFWEEKLNNGEEIPVFWLGKTDKIDSFGLTMMYRLPYKFNIHEAINKISEEHFSKEKYDLAELIFGYTNDNNSQKGRVQFGHLKGNNSSSMDIVKTVLGGPKATYYPNYIEQDEKLLAKTNSKGKLKPEYKTFMSDDVKIRGWKRYPVRNDNYDPTDKSKGYIPKIPVDKYGKPNMEVTTSFKPLATGSFFDGRIRFHNLKEIELGALLWALTFGDNEGFRHSIGMGKGLGFGNISIKIKNFDSKKYIEKFVEYMKTEVDKWETLPQLKELLAMANPKNEKGKNFKYPSLKPNDFVEFKQNGRQLFPYTDKRLTKEVYKPKVFKKPVVKEKSEVEKIIDKLEKENVKNLKKSLKSLQLFNLNDDNIKLIGTKLKKRPDSKNKYNPQVSEYFELYEKLKT